MDNKVEAKVEAKVEPKVEAKVEPKETKDVFDDAEDLLENTSSKAKETVSAVMKGIKTDKLMDLRDYINKVSRTPELNVSDDNCNIGRYIYSVFHIIMTFVAVYLVYKCNNQFRLGPFIVALFFPYLYIIYTLATKGTCGLLEVVPAVAVAATKAATTTPANIATTIAAVAK